MSRSIPFLAAALVLAACDTIRPDESVATADVRATTPETLAAAGAVLDITREPVAGDVSHYEITLDVGDTPNAQLHVHRVVRELAPWLPRPSHAAAMLLHGDFSSFRSNFLPEGGGLAGDLASRGIDVWGVDRRWAHTPADGDVSDFGAMGLAQELGDVRTALSFARSVRLVTGSGGDRLTLVGFSRGGQLAYAYASQEAARPRAQRHVDGLVPLDIYAAIAPEDADIRQFQCDGAAAERQALAEGVVAADTSFFALVGQLALAAPDDPSPIFDGLSNRDALLVLVGQTYFFAPFTPTYHLAAPVLVDGMPTGLRESPEARIAGWLASAGAYQSMRELAEADGLWCGEPPLAIDAPLDRIEIPLLYVGAAGGIGDHGLYSTTQVASMDVTTLVVRRLAPEQEAEDFGHGDVLFATEADTLVWQPLAAWIGAH